MVLLSERPGIKKISSLEDKFMYEIAAMYDAENRFLEAQQMMWQSCQHNALKSAIETHIRETEEQIHNLEEVFTILGQEVQRVNCDAAAGLISDAQKFMLLATNSPKIVDLGMVGGQCKIEQLEVACYRSLIKVAEQIGQNQVVQLLQQNLQQEEQTAQKLEQMMPQLLQEAKQPEAKASSARRN